VTLNNKAKLEQQVTELNKERERNKWLKARKENFSALNSAIVETLCLYGNSLREVQTEEYISLIIKGAGYQQSRGFKDQILVFNTKYINTALIVN
jgi:hypothetical protein